MSARITAAEAAAILRDLARGREDGNGADVWPLYDRAEDAMAAVIGLAAESDAHRTRADAAEADLDALRAECERLRAIVEGRAVLTPLDVAAHALAHPVAFGTASNGASCDTSPGLWLCVVDGEGVKVLALAVDHDDAGPYLMAWSGEYGWCGTGDIRHALPLAADGTPCAWPVTP